MEKEKNSREKVIGNKYLNITKRVNGSYYLDGNTNFIVFIIVFIPIFLIALLVSRNFIFSLISTVFLYIITAIIIFVNDYFGKKMHAKIFKKQIFQDLMMNGFKKEEIGKYEGLTTEKNGRTIRVFYDWNKFAGGFLSFGDIVIDILYEPQIKQEHLKNAKSVKLTLKTMKSFTKIYDKSFWSEANRVIFALFKLQLYFNYYPWTSSKKIMQKINFGLKILDQHNLKPISIKNIKNSEFQIFEEEFYPNTQHINEYLEATNKKNNT